MTGTRWEIAETTGRSAAQPVRTGTGSARHADSEILESPLVKAALEAFPEAMK
jgi:hypothetical protein